MNVRFCCGYYPDRAHKNLARRTEDYWNAYFYVWAVKVGSFRKGFYILNAGRQLNIVRDNFPLVRKIFGQWAAQQIAALSSGDVLVVPVPSKDGKVGGPTYRALGMAQESLNGTPYESRVFDGLRWTKEAKKAHEGGSRKRADLFPLLAAAPGIVGRRVVLIDDLLSTGGSLLACSDRLEASGATVLGAVVCGKTIYDFKTPPFGTEAFKLNQELADWPLG